MDKKIINYISTNKVFTIATCNNHVPYCANCFYVFDSTTNTLIFLSDDETRHIIEAKKNKNVAGTINTDVISVAKIKGIQFIGQFICPEEAQEEAFYLMYYKKFPFAKAKPSKIWGINLTFIKMTDNTLGFGKKLIWER